MFWGIFHTGSDESSVRGHRQVTAGVFFLYNGGEVINMPVKLQKLRNGFLRNSVL